MDLDQTQMDSNSNTELRTTEEYHDYNIRTIADLHNSMRTLFEGTVPRISAQNKRLVLAAISSNEKCSEIITQIIDTNLNLAIKIARGSTTYRLYFDEVSEDHKNLFRVEIAVAAINFDIDKGKKFSNFVSRFINNRIIKILNHHGTDLLDHAQELPEESRISTSTRNQLRRSTEEIFFSRERISLLYNIMQTYLDSRQQEILKLRFGLNGDEPMDLEDIGQLFGIKWQRVQQIIAQITRKFTNDLEPEDINFLISSNG